jgi:hypothetical protein
MTALTRGPLAPRVYWTRRVMVFGTALLLVFGIARLLNGGSDASSNPEPQAVQAAAPRGDGGQADDLPPPPVVSRDTETKKQQKKKDDKPTEPPLAAPSGPCEDEDIAATPEIEKAVAGSPIRVTVGLRTIESEACTWQVSPETLTLKITSGKDAIWSSRECPRAIEKQDVVVRRAVTQEVTVVWSARRSDDECSRQTQWALPGWYHVAVAALAGEPSDAQFELVRPQAEVVTESPDPKGGKREGKNTGKNTGKNDGQDDGKNHEPKHR